MTPKGRTEQDFISQIRKRIKDIDTDIIMGIGDDCAVLRTDQGKLELITTDTLVEAVHFDMSWHPPQLLGRKAASVNISDIAAMGGVPRFALLSVAISPSIKNDWIDLFLAGFIESLEEHNVVLIGGDTVKSVHEAMFSVSIIGEVEENRSLYRSGAKVGDQIWVSGYLGEAAAGLALCQQGVSIEDHQWHNLINAHLDPEAQVNLGRILAASGLVHAMMDISDGLATDLAHICEESKVGAEIVAENLPISENLIAAAAFCKKSSEDWALKGGEDYHLLFTCADEDGTNLCKMVKEKSNMDIFCVGRIVEGKGVVFLKDGQRNEITYQGFDHFK